MSAPSGCLLQVGGQEQRVLGFNLPPVIPLTRQQELGARMGWSSARLMVMGKWGQRGGGGDWGVRRDGKGAL